MDEQEQVKQQCDANFNPSAATLTGSLSLSWPAAGSSTSTKSIHLNRLAFSLIPGRLDWLPEQTPTQAEFAFADAQRLADLLFSTPDPYQELLTQFMAGDIRSSGYLLWTFPLLGLFRGAR